MMPLPLTPYEPAVWTTATILQDYLISDGKNKYSVPFDLIKERVDIRLTQNTDVVFFHGSRVASHPRRQCAERDPIINLDHMPNEHKKYLSYNEDEFRLWASSIGPQTKAVIERYLTMHKVPEQGYKACASLTKLADRYDHNRLESACYRALLYSIDPSIRNVSTILKNGQDKVSESSGSKTLEKSADISRGTSYYKRGGADNA
ncbi:hypothetical protein M2145_000543 [Lachnospiraceae bacterium PF1-21]|uniref:Mu transposase domain-containing protein n=1 Tax=Ohessyouella blattaphilus TaxID=2949333 RepID=UPI003E220FC6